MITKPRAAQPRIHARRQEQTIWICLHGERDVGCVSQLEASLADIDCDGTTAVHLYVANLDFCDGASLRQLVRFAQEASLAGHEVTTIGARPIFRKMARLCDATRDLGLR